MSPMKRYKMVCERRLTSTDVCIHPRRSTEDTEENSEPDVTTTATSSESFQYTLKKRHRNKEKCIPESTSSSLLGPSVGDALVDTVEYTGELINLMINGETEVDEESESKSSEEVERHLSPGDVAYNQMRFILSPRADDVILGVIDACKYCCMGICRGDIDFVRRTKKKSKYKRRGEIQDWMKMEVSREKGGHSVDKKGRNKLQDETTSMEDDNIRIFEQKRLEQEKALEEEKITLLEEKCKLEEEKRKIMEERMKLMEKKKRLFGEAIASSTEENIYETRGRLEDDTEDKDTATEIKRSSTDKSSGVREGGSFEGRVSTTDNKISREMDSKSSSTDSYNLKRISALKGNPMEMDKRNSSDRGSKDLDNILGTHATSFESKSAEIRGSPEMRSISSLQKRSIDFGSREENRNGLDKGSKDVESRLQKQGSIGSRKSAEIETIPQKLSGSGLERSTEMGSIPQIVKSNGSERRSGEIGAIPTKHSCSCEGKQSTKMGSIPHIVKSNGSKRRSGEIETISTKHSCSCEGKQLTEMGGIPQIVITNCSDRSSGEIETIPTKHSCSCEGKQSTELENIPQTMKSNSSERRSGEIGAMPTKHSCSCEGKQSTEMGSIPQIVKSNGSERRSGEIGAIPKTRSCSCDGKQLTEMGRIPQIVISNCTDRSSGEIETIPMKHSCSCEGKQSTELENIPQTMKSNSSERRSGEIGAMPTKHSCSCEGKQLAEMGSIPQIVISNGSERRSGELGAIPKKRSCSCEGKQSTEMGSIPQIEKSNGSERRSGEIETIPSKNSCSCEGKQLAEMGSIPQTVKSNGSERRSGEIGAIPKKHSCSCEGKQSTEMGSIPHIVKSNGSERRSGEIETIPTKHSCSCEGKQSTELGSIPQTVKSNGSERRSGEIETIPTKHSCSCEGKQSTEMGSIPQIVKSNGSERRSGEIGAIPKTHSCSCDGKQLTEMGRIPQIVISNCSDRRSGEIEAIPTKHSCSCEGKQSTELGNVPQTMKSNSSERRSGEIETIQTKHSCSCEGKQSTELGNIPQTMKSKSSERRSGEVGTIPGRFSNTSVGQRSKEMGSIPLIAKSNDSERRSGEIGIIPERHSCSCVRKRSTEIGSAPKVVRSNSSVRRSGEIGTIPTKHSCSSVGKRFTEMGSILQAERSPELERKSSEMDDSEEEDDIKRSELRSPDKETIRELIANYAIVRKSAGTLSAPEALNFSSVIENITPEEFKKLQEEDFRRLKMKSLELQVLNPGEYKEYREEELLKLGKAIEKRRLEWQAIEKRREEEEELRSLERDIKEKLKAVADGEIDSYIQKKSEEEELEKKITELEEKESQSNLRSKGRICSCLRRKWQEREKKKELSEKECEKNIGSPRHSKGSYQSQDLCREVGDRKSMGTMEQDTKIGSERENVRSSKENLERKSRELIPSVKSQDGSKSFQGSETLTPIRSSPRTFNVSDDVAPEREGATEFRTSDSVGSAKPGHLCKKPSFKRDEMCPHHSPRHQPEVSSSEKMRRKIHSEEEIVAFTMEEMSEENNQKGISETKLPAPITERENSSFGAEDKDRIKANCFESDDSIGYKIDIENVIARERSFTKYKIKDKSSDTLKRSLDYNVPGTGTRSNDIDKDDNNLDAGASVRSSRSRHECKRGVARVDTNAVPKSSDTLKRSLDYSFPASEAHSNDIDLGDKGEIYEKQFSDTLRKSLDASASARSSPSVRTPSVRSSRSKHECKRGVARVDTNAVPKSSDTLKRSLDDCVPASETHSNDINLGDKGEIYEKQFSDTLRKSLDAGASVRSSPSVRTPSVRSSRSKHECKRGVARVDTNAVPKSSDTLKRSLDDCVPASETHSNDINLGDKGEIYEKQFSDTLRKSLDAGASVRSSPSVRTPSVRSSRSRHECKRGVARVDTNAVPKSSDTLKRSLDYSVPASEIHSNDIDLGDKGELYEKQSSDPLRKSLDAGASARSSPSVRTPSVRSSRSKHVCKSGVARADTDVVEKSSDTLRKGIDSRLPTSRSRTSRDSDSNINKADSEPRRASMADIGIGTYPEDLTADELKSKAARASLIDGVGSDLELALVSTGVGTSSIESLASVDKFRKLSTANIEVETSSADKMEQNYFLSPTDLGKRTDVVSTLVDSGMMAEPDALPQGVKEVNEITRPDEGVGTHSTLFRNESGEEIHADKEKERACRHDSISTSISQNRDVTSKMAFTQVDTEETIFTKNMSVGSMTSRIDVKHTAVRVKNVSVGCGRSVADLGRTTVNINSVSVACGNSTTDADSLIDPSQEDHLGRKKRKKLRFVAVTEDELSSKEFKTMKIRALRHCNKTEEPDWSSKRFIRSTKKLDSAAGADLTHYLQMKKSLDGSMEIPHHTSTKNLRFHIHNSKGDIVGYGELDNDSVSTHKDDLRVNPEKVTMMKRTEFDRYSVRHPISNRAETYSRSLSSGIRSHTPTLEVHRKIHKDKVGTVWAVARINEFDRGKRTMEIVSTDVKKPTELKTHKGGKYDKEVYVLVPPSKRPSKK